jgi:hypothetical protein
VKVAEFWKNQLDTFLHFFFALGQSLLFWSNATRVKKIDPESKAGIDHSIKFGAWSLVVIFILIVFGSLIGRGQGWWGN